MLGREVADAAERRVVHFRRRGGSGVAQLDLGAQLARACPVDRAVDDDAVQPGCERPAAVESVEMAHGSEEGLLGDVLGRGRVAGDEQRGPVGARPVLAKEPLEIGDRPALGTSDPGAFRHPSTLRRKACTRSIRARDLERSVGRIPPMKRLALGLAAVLLVLPGAAGGAACSPLNCAPSQFSVAHGTLLGFRSGADKPVTVVDLQTGKAKWVLPAGITGGDLLVHQDGATLVWYEVSSGARLDGAALPGVAYRLAGVSQDGTRAVALKAAGATTRAVIVSPGSVRSITLPGRQWQFDALRGSHLFLIRLLDLGGYQVRLFHLDSGRLDARPLKDPHESGTIWGSPFSRLASPDGRHLFTVYIGSNGGAMIHDLDLQAATARCIDLPGTGDYNAATSWTLALSKDERTLHAVSSGYRRVVAIDVRDRKVTDAFRIDLPSWTIGAMNAALSPDGGRIAIANGEAIAVVDLAARRIVDRRTAKKTIAVGYSPDGSTLWKLS